MTIKEAREILVRFNEWRRYDSSLTESPRMENPKEIGIAIDTVVNLETFSKDDINNAYQKGYDDGSFDATH
jgi:hypothetical protein